MNRRPARDAPDPAGAPAPARSGEHHGPILHLAEPDDWAAAGHTYVPATFEADGFVHCSAPHQIAAVAEARFPGRTDLVLLTIDPSHLSAPVVWEDLSGEGRVYPHVYGPIDRTAVLEHRPFRPDEHGHFPRPL